MKQIKAKIVADSINLQGDRITTFLLTYPRFIHAELMTHRMFSRNSASSRAIPFHKMVKMVETDPFIPIAWQFDHKGMQGIEYVTEESDFGGISARNESWLSARDYAIQQAKDLNSMDTTKQLCNRLLEPFMWHTVLVTATEFENFFELRCPSYLYDYEDEPIYFKSKKEWIKYYNESQGYKENNPNFTKVENLTDLEWLQFNKSQADIHIQAIAEMMWDCYNESKPKTLQSGDWHIPFGDGILIPWKEGSNLESNTQDTIKIATARCARISYETLGDNPKIDYEADIKLHDRLLLDKHLSPFEHCARAMSNEEYRTFIRGKCEVNPISEKVISPVLNEGWCNNFRGWISYRYLIENK